MLKRIIVAVAGYAAYRWWNKRGAESQPSRRDDVRPADAAE